MLHMRHPAIAIKKYRIIHTGEKYPSGGLNEALCSDRYQVPTLVAVTQLPTSKRKKQTDRKVAKPMAFAFGDLISVFAAIQLEQDYEGTQSKRATEKSELAKVGQVTLYITTVRLNDLCRARE
jgi:hypothetical protein